MLHQLHIGPNARQWSPSLLLMVWFPLGGLLSGCCGPLVRSDRLPHLRAERACGVPDDCAVFAVGLDANHGPGHVPLIPDRIFQACRPALHCLAGPFVPREIVGQYQSTIRPPHSKFHPLPTRPVFAARADYSPPWPRNTVAGPAGPGGLSPDGEPRIFHLDGRRAPRDVGAATATPSGIQADPPPYAAAGL